MMKKFAGTIIDAMIVCFVLLVCIFAAIDTASAITWQEVQDKLNSVDPTFTIPQYDNGVYGVTATSSDGPLRVKKNKKAVIYMNSPVDRNLTSPKDNGYVIKVEGELTIYCADNVMNQIRGGNNTGNGGGIYIADGGVLRFSGHIAHNTAEYGGGIYVAKGGTLILESGQSNTWGNVFENTARKDGGGIFVEEGGTFIQEGGEIYSNVCEAKGGVGCGVFTAGTYRMSDGYVRNHESQRSGAGVLKGH